MMRARLTVRRRLSLGGDSSIDFVFILLSGDRTDRRALGTCAINAQRQLSQNAMQTVCDNSEMLTGSGLDLPSCGMRSPGIQ